MRRLLAVAAVAVLLPMLFVQAEPRQTPTKTTSEEASFLQKLKQAWQPPRSTGGVDDKTLQSDEIMERIWCGDVPDERTRDMCWQAYQARMTYYIGAMGHRSRVFWWQHMAGGAIFFVVVGLVIVGIYFAWIQFRKDITGAAKDEQHQIELATSGVKVSSPVLGVIILIVSLAFFYLYLVYVFPIVETF